MSHHLPFPVSTRLKNYEIIFSLYFGRVIYSISILEKKRSSKIESAIRFYPGKSRVTIGLVSPQLGMYEYILLVNAK